jgi:hypothetical protein
MLRTDVDIDTVNASLKMRPQTLNSISVGVAVLELTLVVLDCTVRIAQLWQSLVGTPLITVNVSVGLNTSLYLR